MSGGELHTVTGQALGDKRRTKSIAQVGTLPSKTRHHLFALSSFLMDGIPGGGKLEFCMCIGSSCYRDDLLLDGLKDMV